MVDQVGIEILQYGQQTMHVHRGAHPLHFVKFQSFLVRNFLVPTSTKKYPSSVFHTNLTSALPCLVSTTGSRRSSWPRIFDRTVRLRPSRSAQHLQQLEDPTVRLRLDDPPIRVLWRKVLAGQPIAARRTFRHVAQTLNCLGKTKKTNR